MPQESRAKVDEGVEGAAKVWARWKKKKSTSRASTEFSRLRQSISPPAKTVGALTRSHILFTFHCARLTTKCFRCRACEMGRCWPTSYRYKSKSNLLSSSSFGVSRLETIAPPHATRHRRQHYAGSKRATSRPTCLSIIVPVALLKLGECLLVQCDMIQATRGSHSHSLNHLQGGLKGSG